MFFFFARWDMSVPWSVYSFGLPHFFGGEELDSLHQILVKMSVGESFGGGWVGDFSEVDEVADVSKDTSDFPKPPETNAFIQKLFVKGQRYLPDDMWVRS